MTNTAMVMASTLPMLSRSLQSEAHTAIPFVSVDVAIHGLKSTAVKCRKWPVTRFPPLPSFSAKYDHGRCIFSQLGQYSWRGGKGLKRTKISELWLCTDANKCVPHLSKILNIMFITYTLRLNSLWSILCLERKASGALLSMPGMWTALRSASDWRSHTSSSRARKNIYEECRLHAPWLLHVGSGCVVRVD